MRALVTYGLVVLLLFSIAMAIVGAVDPAYILPSLFMLSGAVGGLAVLGIIVLFAILVLGRYE